VNAANKVELKSSYSLDPVQRENQVRTWIARKESVCPYAPGLARFVHLPEMNSLKMEHVYYLAHELKAFYEDKDNGKRVGRWMLMPHREWESHAEAHRYSEQIFWLLNAAYFHLLRDKKSVRAALNKEIQGYDRGYNEEILNPVVGNLPKRNAGVIPAKSLFYSALSPLYKSKQFYRYCPHSVMPLVYAYEFEELKRKHSKVTENVCFEMAYGGLFEIFGDDLELDLVAFREELPRWGAIIDRIAEIMRASVKGISSNSPEAKACPASNLSYFRLCSPKLVGAFYSKYIENLTVLSSIVHLTQANPKQIIGASFAGSGIYTTPDYPSSERQLQGG
jgi:hypothetical protein